MKKIFILHGWAYNVEKWNNFISSINNLQFKTELLKIPGLTAPIDGTWTIDNYANWLNDCLDNNSTVVGHSNGGRLALYCAYKYPKKIKNLILIDSAGIVHKDMITKIKKTIFTNLAKTGKKFTSNMQLKKLLYKLSRNKDYLEAPENVKQTMINLIEYDLTQILNKIQSRTLIIWGKDDKITPLSDGKIIQENIPDCKMITINQAKHSPQFTHYDLCTKYIFNFLNEINI